MYLKKTAYMALCSLQEEKVVTKIVRNSNKKMVMKKEPSVIFVWNFQVLQSYIKTQVKTVNVIVLIKVFSKKVVQLYFVQFDNDIT